MIVVHARVAALYIPSTIIKFCTIDLSHCVVHKGNRTNYFHANIRTVYTSVNCTTDRLYRRPSISELKYTSHQLLAINNEAELTDTA